MKLLSGNLNQLNKVVLQIEDPQYFNNSDIKIFNGNKIIDIKEKKEDSNTIELILEGTVDIKKESTLTLKDLQVDIDYTTFYKGLEFNAAFFYSGKLGVDYSPLETIFRLWSPIATWVNLLLYKSGDNSINSIPQVVEMQESNGLWSVTMEENLEGYFYNYEVNTYGNIYEAVDPYAKAAGINGKRGAIIDLSRTNPEGWEKDISPVLASFTDAIIYETSVRDISMDINSGIKSRGLFLGLTEPNTKNSDGYSTGLSHIKELGITHLQLMPIFDFSMNSVDESAHLLEYNWGYNPENYNFPEGSYSSNPYNPRHRIKEIKKLVKTMHDNNISVNMDVVYNHTSVEDENNLEKIFTGYYFRSENNGILCNGSGCGNDTASERPMVRKMIIDSVLYWAKEYHIDGFRFDLMGLHDIETINEVRAKLDELGRPIMVYGEGWNLNTSLPEAERATQSNASKLPHIGFFNDSIRDTIKGSVFNIFNRGFVNGNKDSSWELRKSIAGSIAYNSFFSGKYSLPEQSINYFSAHDNNTLWDKLKASNGDSSVSERKNMMKLSSAIILTSQGIPFLHSGEEFCRTKFDISDSYKSSDYVNEIDWKRKTEFLDVFVYVKGLIKLRKMHPAFRMKDVEAIRENLVFSENLPESTLMFTLKNNANNDPWKDILVIFYSARFHQNLMLPEGTWNVVVSPKFSGVDVIDVVEKSIPLYDIGAYVMFK